MKTPVILPDLGASPVRFSLWLAEAGDEVFAGECLAEVLASGATFDVPAPVTGRLVERVVWPADLLRPGQVLGIVETDGVHPGKPEAPAREPS
jgi:pyruvate/2-oxoglutarate dehydrogenase complex dihydrolipoamide acyltransferase (E2) component